MVEADPPMPNLGIVDSAPHKPSTNPNLCQYSIVTASLRHTNLYAPHRVSFSSTVAHLYLNREAI